MSSPLPVAPPVAPRTRCSDASSRAFATTRSSCSTPRGTSRPGTPAPSGSRATRADEIIGQHFSIFYPAEAVARRAGRRKSCEGAAEQGRFEDEGWRVRKDGTRFWANVVITALRDADGRADRLRQGHARPDRAAPARGGSCAQSEERFRLLSKACRTTRSSCSTPTGASRSWNAGASASRATPPTRSSASTSASSTPPEDQQAGKPRAASSAVAPHQGRVEDEGWRVRKDGTRVLGQRRRHAVTTRPASCAASPRSPAT